MANLIEQSDRKRKAEMILESEVFMEAFDAMEKASISAFDRASLGSANELMMAKAQRVATIKFREWFLNLIKAGKLAEQKIRKEQEART